MSSIELVPFHDDQIEAIRLLDGRPCAVIRRLCENLGVDFSSQLAKLKGYHWASVVMITIETAAGPRETALLPINQIPMWLVKIDDRRVAADIRPKLRVYQLEAKDALAAHFMPPMVTPVEPTNQASGTALIRMMCDAIDKTDRRVDALTATVQEFAKPLEQIVQAHKQLESLPRAEFAAVPQSTRAKINERVRGYGKAKTIDIQRLWGQAYRKFYYIYHIDAKARQKHDPGKYPTLLDVVAECSLLEEFFAIVCDYVCPDEVTE